MYKILITGGLGFIGSHIVDYFVNTGHDVTIIDNTSSNVLSEKHFDSLADVFTGDIADQSMLDAVFSDRKYDYIFHFAANASVPKSVEDEDLNFRSNVIGTYNVLRKAVKYRSSIIFASTAAIYGEYNGKKVNEEDSARPISPYGLSKLIDEDLCFHYGRIYGIKVISFRFFNVYGPRQRRYVMSDFIKKLVTAHTTNSATFLKDIPMLGTGDEIRDFINIRDVVSAILLPLKNDSMWGEAYNVGTGTGTRIKDLLCLMSHELNQNYNISFSGKSWQGDVSGLYANINKIRRFGFDPVIDLRVGIREFIEAERINGLLSSRIS